MKVKSLKIEYEFTLGMKWSTKILFACLFGCVCNSKPVWLLGTVEEVLYMYCLSSIGIQNESRVKLPISYAYSVRLLAESYMERLTSFPTEGSNESLKF